MAESWDACQGELEIGSSNNPRERKMLQSAKLKEIRDGKSTSTLDMKILSLEFTQTVFGLALVQYFLFPYLPFGIVMCFLFRCMLEENDLLFILILKGLKLRDCFESQKKLNF